MKLGDYVGKGDDGHDDDDNNDDDGDDGDDDDDDDDYNNDDDGADDDIYCETLSSELISCSILLMSDFIRCSCEST